MNVLFQGLFDVNDSVEDILRRLSIFLTIWLKPFFMYFGYISKFWCDGEQIKIKSKSQGQKVLQWEYIQT